MPKKNIPKELEGAGNISPEDLDSRINSLEERFGDNEKIAKTLCEVSENIKNFDKLFEKALLILVKNNTDIKTAIKNIIDENDRVASNKLLKRFGVIIAWVISIIITAIITAWVTGLSKK